MPTRIEAPCSKAVNVSKGRSGEISHNLGSTFKPRMCSHCYVWVDNNGLAMTPSTAPENCIVSEGENLNFQTNPN